MNFLEVSMLIGSVVLIAFAFQLFTFSAGNLLLNKLLAIFFLNRAFSQLLVLSISFHAESYLKFLYPISSIFLFLSPAAIYLYARSFISDSSKLKNNDYLHLIPGVIVLINLMPSLIDLGSVTTDQIIATLRNNGFNSDIRVLFIPYRIQLLLRSAIQLTYLVLTWQIVIEFLFKKDARIFAASKYHLSTLLGWFTLIEIAAILVTFRVIFMNQSFEFIISSSELPIGSILIMFGIIIWFLRHPIILYGNLIFDINTDKEDIQTIDFNQVGFPDSAISDIPQVPSTDPKIAKQIAVIEKLMIERKPFLDPEFDLETLADMMNMPVHHCSYFLNQVLRKSFKEYLNSYRISYFIQIYNEKSDKYTIDVLASEVGYRHRSTFNIAFKNNTGKTPTQYFNLLQSAS